MDIVFVGLDNSGKTTIINNLQGNYEAETTPTIGYNVDKLTIGNFMFTIIDMSGMDTNRDLWESQYYNCNAIVFVVDSADDMRYQVASYEFESLLNHAAIKNRNIPILIYLNKMDLKESCSYQECVDFLQLDQVKDKSWNLQPSNAISGTGLKEGLQWLIGQLKKIN